MINSCTSSYTTSESETGISKPRVKLQRTETFFDINRGIRGLANFAPELLDGSASGSHVEQTPFAAITHNPDFAEDLELALEEAAEREETNQRIEFWLRSGQNTPFNTSITTTLPQSPFHIQESETSGNGPLNIISCEESFSISDEFETAFSEVQEKFAADLQSDEGEDELLISNLDFSRRRHTI